MDFFGEAGPVEQSLYVKLRRDEMMLDRKNAGCGAVFATGFIQDIGHVRVDGAHADM